MKRGGVMLPVLLAALQSAAAWASDCRVVDYPDHFEVICEGAAAKAPAPPAGRQDRGGAAAVVAPEPEPEPVRIDPLPEQIVRNGLARSLGETWLKTRPQGR